MPKNKKQKTTEQQAKDIAQEAIEKCINMEGASPQDIVDGLRVMYDEIGDRLDAAREELDALDDH